MNATRGAHPLPPNRGLPPGAPKARPGLRAPGHPPWAEAAVTREVAPPRGSRRLLLKADGTMLRVRGPRQAGQMHKGPGGPGGLRGPSGAGGGVGGGH